MIQKPNTGITSVIEASMPTIDQILRANADKPKNIIDDAKKELNKPRISQDFNKIVSGQGLLNLYEGLGLEDSKPFPQAGSESSTGEKIIADVKKILGLQRPPTQQNAMMGAVNNMKMPLKRGRPRMANLGIASMAPKPQGMPQGMPQGIPQGIPQGMPRPMPQGMPQGIMAAPQGALNYRNRQMLQAGTPSEEDLNRIAMTKERYDALDPSDKAMINQAITEANIVDPSIIQGIVASEKDIAFRGEPNIAELRQSEADFFGRAAKNEALKTQNQAVADAAKAERARQQQVLEDQYKKDTSRTARVDRALQGAQRINPFGNKLADITKAMRQGKNRAIEEYRTGLDSLQASRLQDEKNKATAMKERFAADVDLANKASANAATRENNAASRVLSSKNLLYTISKGNKEAASNIAKTLYDQADKKTKNLLDQLQILVDQEKNRATIEMNVAKTISLITANIAQQATDMFQNGEGYFAGSKDNYDILISKGKRDEAQVLQNKTIQAYVDLVTASLMDESGVLGQLIEKYASEEEQATGRKEMEGIQAILSNQSPNQKAAIDIVGSTGT